MTFAFVATIVFLLITIVLWFRALLNSQRMATNFLVAAICVALMLSMHMAVGMGYFMQASARFVYAFLLLILVTDALLVFRKNASLSRVPILLLLRRRASNDSREKLSLKETYRSLKKRFESQTNSN